MRRKGFLLKTGIAGAIFFIIIAVTGIRLSHGYVMPSEQLLDLMSGKFSSFKTLVIIQSTLQVTKGSEKVFKEQISMKSPDRFSLRALDRLGERADIPDMSFRQLLMSNRTWDLEKVLSVMGIDTEKTAFTRFNGVISYRIGEDGPGCPKLIIEKERFLPLLLEYRIPWDASGSLISVHFKDYREEGKGWYPYEIIYSPNESLIENYSIQTIQVNTEVDMHNLQPFRITADSEIPEADDQADIDLRIPETNPDRIEDTYRQDTEPDPHEQ